MYTNDCYAWCLVICALIVCFFKIIFVFFFHSYFPIMKYAWNNVCILV